MSAPSIVPIAHAGHWLESLAFALPPVVLVAVLIGVAIYARRQASGSSDTGAAR